MKKFLKKPYFIFAALIAVFLTCFAIHSEVSASALKVKDGQKLCGTFTFNVSKSSDGVKKQDFQVCGIVDKKKNFKSSLELRNGNWNNSIAYVSINGNILNIYDSPMNQGAIIGSLGAVYIGDQKQFIPTVGQNFETYLKSIKTYLNSLKDRKYWHKISNTDSVSSKATFKNQIDWSKEDVTADDANLVANNKAKCEAKGYTWKGNDAEGYECVDADGNVADASLSITGSTTYNPSTVNACYSNAGAVGWMLCPVIDGATAAANGMYQIIEESFLKIDVSDLFDDSNGVEQAWSAFRDIANIVFIILFIVVILSQLTGFGIDNYGIKKILPRLIVVAVLINLSYIICQLAVDVSNIIGVSLREFLTGLVPQGDLGTNADGAQWTVALAGGALALGGVTAATLLGGLGAIFAILGAIITAVVAIFFLWIILVIRSAGVVLLIAIAPLAIACYLLPNTEKLSKRWLDIFKALLILYPLSSLVIGAGALAGRILSFSNNEVMVLAAMIVQVVPFFFIPMLLRQSLAGLGNIGARLSNIGRTQGRNLSGRARQGLNNTNFAQNRRDNALNRRRTLTNNIARSDWVTRDGYRPGKGIGRLIGGSAQTQQRRAQAANKWEQDQIKAMQYSWTDENGNTDMNKATAALEELANHTGPLDNMQRATMRAAMDTISAAAPDMAMRYITGEEGNMSASIRQQMAAYATSTNPQLLGQMKGEDLVRAEYVKSLGTNTNRGQDFTTWATDTNIYDNNGNITGQGDSNALKALRKASHSEILRQKDSAFQGNTIQFDALRDGGLASEIMQDTNSHSNGRQSTLDRVRDAHQAAQGQPNP